MVDSVFEVYKGFNIYKSDKEYYYVMLPHETFGATDVLSVESGINSYLALGHTGLIEVYKGIPIQELLNTFVTPWVLSYVWLCSKGWLYHQNGNENTFYDVTKFTLADVEADIDNYLKYASYKDVDLTAYVRNGMWHVYWQYEPYTTSDGHWHDAYWKRYDIPPDFPANTNPETIYAQVHTDIDTYIAYFNTIPKWTGYYRCTGPPNYNCVGDPSGPYASLDSCLASCVKPKPPPPKKNIAPVIAGVTIAVAIGAGTAYVLLKRKR